MSEIKMPKAIAKKNQDKAIEEILNGSSENETQERKITMIDFAEQTKKDYEEFDENAWNKGEGYKCPGYPLIEKNLEGFETGLYIFAGESNSGKTAIMINIMKDMCSYRPNKLFGIYYSLDDNKKVIIPRIIAMEQEIPISVASKPKRYQNMVDDCDNDNAIIYQQQLEKRQIGLEKLKEEADIFRIEDSSVIENSTDLLEHITMVQTYVKSIDPEMNIVVAIDSINDIQLDAKAFGRRISDKNEKSEEIAKLIKKIAVDLDVIIFASCHLRKLNGNRRPTLDDLREANTLVYEASLIWLVYNDVSKNKGAANIFWADQNTENGKGAIIELDWSKNKISSYKGRSFCKFMPYYSLCKACTEQENQNFETLVYQN